MDLHALLLFVDPARYDQVRAIVESVGISTYTHDGVEGTFVYRSFEASISQVGVMFAESNSFHRHRDFEVGFSEPTAEALVRLRTRIEAAGIPTKTAQYEPSAFVVGEDHAPLFFVPWAAYSEQNSVLSFRGEVSRPELARYEQLTALLKSDFLWDKFVLEPSPTGSYLVHYLELANSGLVPTVLECPGVFRLEITTERVRFLFG